ncbi:hypothetical protein CVT26_009030 [Gymnopilus dilepis]|uniref:Uncharacterized protein n=1 Tax=Gymnopilus dilepis TaxID=231916 RepID=A0A409YB99_9AGAR|nr:hypothetical protein CVT26_009030 [Gymnopilus dilepis]
MALIIPTLRRMLATLKQAEAKEVREWSFIASGLLSFAACWTVAGLIIAWLHKVPPTDVHVVYQALFPVVSLTLAMIIATTTAVAIIVVTLRNATGGWSTFMMWAAPIVNIWCFFFFAPSTSWHPGSGLASCGACWILAGVVIAWVKKVPPVDKHAVNKALLPSVSLSLALVIATVLAICIL